MIRCKEVLMLFGIFSSVFLFVALVSYSPDDDAWSYIGSQENFKNLMGYMGAWISDVLFYFLGLSAWIIPVSILRLVIYLVQNRYQTITLKYTHFIFKFLGFILIIMSISCLSSFFDYDDEYWRFSKGGVVGYIIMQNLTYWLNNIGAIIFTVWLLLTGLTIYSQLSWFKLIDEITELSRYMWNKITYSIANIILALFQSYRKKLPIIIQYFKASLHKDNHQKNIDNTHSQIKSDRNNPLSSSFNQQNHQNITTQSPILFFQNRNKIDNQKQNIHYTEHENNEKNNTTNKFVEEKKFKLPEVELLDKNTLMENKSDHKYLNNTAQLLEEKLSDFGIQAEVVHILPGPVITRYEIQLAAGTKASKVTNIATDLARSLAVHSVRVVEVISGKTVIGIEIPNNNRATVCLSEVIASSEFNNAESLLSLALGHDISGEAVIVSLAKMPHLLVAGTTGSGKSVGINAMILSILFKATPEEIRMIMVDPKMLELSVYDGIPHLLSPVVTDMKEAASALRWCVTEMDRRYQLMAHLGVRNITNFNEKIKMAKQNGTPLIDPFFDPTLHGNLAQKLHSLPFIVVIIDEFADMMMIVGKKVEELIARLAQKARAAGIHLILATQRPSVDVITGLIKANIPTRISFQVSSKIDSRTIIDQCGAEQLLGHGDMLYLPPGTSMPIRIHGAFVSDDEVHRVVNDWKNRGQPNYIKDILNNDEISLQNNYLSFQNDGEQDELFDQVVEFVTQTRKVSISSVQRKFRIGYNRSANIIDSLEKAGIISAAEPNGTREVIAPEPPISET